MTETRTLYALYLRSFADHGANGHGTLRGATGKLAHVAELGADTVWLSPFYRTRMVDAGYDVVDHCAVDPRFGTLDDVRALIREADRLGLDVLVDLVFNHTSDRHPWFLGAAARDGRHDDWYVFADAKPDGSVPNNWTSQFGRPAWRWVPQRRQYVLAQFHENQPCLDLRNRAVQDALSGIVAFWRGEGVAGFRLDAVAAYLTDESGADNPPAPDAVRQASAQPTFNPYSWQDHVHDMLPGDGAEFGRKIRSWAGKDAFLIGEINSGNRSIELAREFARPGRLDAAYTVDLTNRPLTAGLIDELMRRLDGGPILWMMSNHDGKRHLSRAGDGSPGDAKFLATLLLSLPGHVGLYQGEELGLPQVDLDYDDLLDPFDRAFHPCHPGRDGARVPLPWSADGPAFGFTGSRPFLPQPADWGRYAVDRAEADAGSVLRHYRAAIALRRAHPALHAGAAEVERAADDVLVLRRTVGGQAIRAVLNFGAEGRPRPALPGARILSSNGRPAEPGTLAPRTAEWWLDDRNSSEPQKEHTS